MIIAGWECGVQTLFNNFGNLKNKHIYVPSIFAEISWCDWSHLSSSSMQEMPKLQTSMQFMLISDTLCFVSYSWPKRLFHFHSYGSKDRKSIMFKTDHGWRKNLNDKEILLFSIDLRNFSLFFSTPKIRYYWLNHPSPHAPLFLLCSKYLYLLLQCWLQEKEHYALSKP